MNCLKNGMIPFDSNLSLWWDSEFPPVLEPTIPKIGVAANIVKFV